LADQRGRPASRLPPVRIPIRLTPSAGVDRIDDVVEGTLRARVAARPVDGAANAALVRLLAGELGVRSRQVSIVRGATGRAKLVQVDDVEPGLVRSRWPGVDV